MWESLFLKEVAPIYPKKDNLCSEGARRFYWEMGTGLMTEELVENRLIPVIKQKKDEEKWQENGGQWIPQFAKFLEKSRWREIDLDPRYLPEKARIAHRMHHNPRKIPR